MHNLKFKWLRLGLVVLMSVLALSPLGRLQQAEAQQVGPRVGIVCTESSSPNPIFTLNTQTGYILLPDGNTMFMWGYALDGEPFQHPSPVLCVNENETVTVVLHNTFDEPVSIMFPGQENVLADGQPAQPVIDGSGNLVSMTNTATAGGGSVTYSFVASKPGTFIYESGTDPDKQVNMGLFGVLVVRPVSGANFAYDRSDSQFTPGEEFLALLSEIDPYQHQAAEQGTAFYDANYNIANYHTHYWLLNGRAFPDSIADNFAPWLPSQPYGSLAMITPYDGATPEGYDLPGDIHPLPGLVRYVNVGTEDIPHHPHGNNGVIIGRDGNPLEGPSGQDLSFEKFAVNIGTGQTWDGMVKWYDAEQYGMTSLYTNATGGDFTLTFDNQTTGPIAYTATAVDVQNALEGLININSAFVSGSGTAGDPWIIKVLSSPMADPSNVDLIVDGTNLAGTSTIQNNPVGVTIPDVANQTIGMFWSGSPYLGQMGPMPPGVSTLNQCGEYYIISHNHALFQLDAWGMTMAGQITYLRVDPPGHAGCPTP